MEKQQRNRRISPRRKPKPQKGNLLKYIFIVLVLTIVLILSIKQNRAASKSLNEPETPFPSRKTEKEEELTVEKKTNIAPNKMRTVVVVGGGLAGQSAAIEAARAGAKVILLEKEPRLGGNSAKATSGINAWGTKAQAEQGVEDSAKYFERDTFLSGKGGNSQAGLVKMLSQKSADAIQWLTSFDIPLTVLSQLGGASRKRCHRAPEKPDGTPLPIGFTIIKAMEKQLKETFAGDVTLEMNAKLRRLLSETITLPNGESAVQVSGVEYLKGASPDQEGEVVQLRADAVILATGGFSNDHTTNSLLEQYAPQLAEFPTTNGPWATGDGVKAARELNVALVDMDKVQLHPTGLLNPKDPNAKTVFLGPEALRGSGGILLNKKGERFINELDLRSVVSKAIIDQNDVYPDTTRKFAFCVLNDEAASLFGRGTLEFYWKKFGLFTYAEDVKALAELIGVPEEKVAASLSEYEALSTGKERCPLTGKSVYPCVLGPKGPFYVAYVTPSIHYTMGGCLISPSAEILSAEVGVFGSRKPIYGLFGAGEVSGGVHGGNRLGGNSLLECVVFGRIAGRRASEVTAVASPALTNDWVSAVVREILPEDSAQAQGLTEGSRLLEIALPSPLAVSGLSPLQTLALRLGTKTAVVRPASSPHQLGSVLVALPPLPSSLPEWLYHLLPGDVVEMSTSGTEKVALNPSGTLYVVANAPEGSATAMQLVQLSTEKNSAVEHLHLLYSAKNHSTLSFRRLVKECEDAHKGRLTCQLALEEPPLEWTEEVGPVGAEVLAKFLPPVCEGKPCGGKTATIVVTGNVHFTRGVVNFLKEKKYEEGFHIISLSD